MNLEKKLAYLRKQNEVHPIRATRGLVLETIQPGQLHCLLDSDDLSEVFFLILRKCGNYFLGIPGSLHGRMAGNHDIILPKYVMGDYVFLSMDLAKVLPASSISNGFARLDDETFENVEKAYEYFKLNKPGPYPFALPYGSDNDPMAQYHEQIRDLVNRLGDLAQTIRSHFSDSPLLFKKALVFPAPMAIARDVSSLRRISLPFMLPQPQQEEPASERRKTAQCRMQDYDGFIFDVEYFPEDGILQFTCQTSDGKNTTHHFDSWYLADDSGTIFCKIINGSAEIFNLELWNGVLCLIDNKEQIHILIPE